MTGTLSDADNPSGSVAVTVSVVDPTPTAAPDTTLPVTETVATDVLELAAEYVSASPSGSRKNGDTSTLMVSPTTAVCGGATGRTAVGGRFGSTTVTLPPTAAESPPGSRAVTVMVAVPAPTAVTVAVLPESATLAVGGAEEIAVYVNASPSGSLNNEATFTGTDSPTVMV